MNLKLLFFVINHAQCANILGVFVFPTVSHQSVFQAIYRELSLKGHKVTVITPNPLNDPSLTNLTEISVSHVYEVLKKIKINNIVSKDVTIFGTLYSVFRFLDVIVETEMNSTKVQRLISDKNEKFDVILLECLYSALQPFAEKFQAPIIGLSSYAALAPQNDIMGNPYHPILYPHLHISSHKQPSLWERVKNVLFVTWSVFHHKYIVIPRSHEMAKTYFGDDIPYVGNLEKNFSLLCLNRNWLLTYTMPIVPAIVELGQVHLKPVKPLPKDLQTILDAAHAGAIYVSFGNTIKSSDLGRGLLKIITEVLSELPYVVIWKWELDHLPDKPSNVIIRKWLPQQDLLAHPNIRAFVTQGGLQSLEKAISQTVPLVVMPFIIDQPLHMRRVIELGIGLGVDPSTVTKEELRKTIIDVSEIRSYKERIEEVCDLLFDKPMKGIDKVVWWSQYVIRHRGANFMRSPSADFSWFSFLILDVFLILAAAVYLSYQFLKLIVAKFRIRLNYSIILNALFFAILCVL